MPLKPLDSEFLSSAFNSDRSLIWIQDEHQAGAATLVKDTCRITGHELINVMLNDAWPLDLEELFSGLDPNKKGIICIREIDVAHEYLGSLIYPALLYYQFRRSSITNLVRIPDSWKFVMITKRDFFIPDRSLYRKFLKLVNVREPIQVK
jgi:hypothetical protein